jgi:hypothetical protein
MRPIDRTAALLPSTHLRTAAASPAPVVEEPAAPGRALVALTAAHAAVRPLARQPDRSRVGFIAQLIATERGLPQTRPRRRVAPSEALAAYRAAQNRPDTQDRAPFARVA